MWYQPYVFSACLALTTGILGYVSHNKQSISIQYFEQLRYHQEICKGVGEEGLSSSFAQLLLNECHDCDISNLSVLHIEEKGYKVDTLEILDISRARKNGKTLLN